MRAGPWANAANAVVMSSLRDQTELVAAVRYARVDRVPGRCPALPGHARQLGRMLPSLPSTGSDEGPWGLRQSRLVDLSIPALDMALVSLPPKPPGVDCNMAPPRVCGAALLLRTTASSTNAGTSPSRAVAPTTSRIPNLGPQGRLLPTVSRFHICFRMGLPLTPQLSMALLEPAYFRLAPHPDLFGPKIIGENPLWNPPFNAHFAQSSSEDPAFKEDPGCAPPGGTCLRTPRHLGLPARTFLPTATLLCSSAALDRTPTPSGRPFRWVAGDQAGPLAAHRAAPLSCPGTAARSRCTSSSNNKTPRKRT